MQIGLSIYVKTEKSKYEYYPFVFYIFPEEPRNIKQNIQFEPKTAEFLKNQNFDFAK